MERDRTGWSGVALDAAVALALLAIGLVGTAPAGLNEGVPTGRATYPLVAVAALALAVRRRWPLATLAVVTVAVTAYLVLGYPYGPILLSFLVAVYTVAAYRPVRTAALAGAGALVAVVTHVLVGTHPLGLIGLMPAAAWVVVPFAVGTTVRLVRENAARGRVDEARRLADAERLRVAREVHDVVGHGLAAIHMQAEIALHLLARKPEQAEAALTAISRTSKEALDELRVTLTVVRRDEVADERAPVPGLAQLPQLRERLAGAGVPVTVEVDGEPRALPMAVDLAAYRVVQEALTNVLRHAGPATATVRIRYAPDEVAVEVTDTGRGAAAGPARTSGSGLAGMRERVTALGGSFTAGPVPGGGFRVHATLPSGRVP
ncbi:MULTISPECIES: sensor histidine kinase [Micromonospora]|uniref:histidine kinase n=1 Tax=Micromonospora solifontis TaxID=2487138 RepID=A0ABX9WN86_9ACTN|nr:MULTISPECIES: sensor histidine kinase [Micromonospora]NES16144.1 sensor histidine kinase [Micromonospora sp. PPF5-17B]NES34868.1 sensor histidine kinase [Micromonospora solifontis]NES57586.1 sensor histidine kinase [Micromonospora sp. PPF5-6]RNM01546.1 sensor histidine kinase [Micromonospora solifontis]